MKPSLEALRRAGNPGRRAIERFITANRFPIMSASGATFVFRGDADAVRVRIFAFGLPGSVPMQRIGDSALWFAQLPLAPGSRIEYKLEVVRNAEEEWILDPLNPLRATDPFGANSVCQAYGYQRPAWSERSESVPRGAVDEVELGPPARRLRMPVWLPAGFRRSRRYPLLLVHDGTDFARYADLGAVLDNLVHRLDVPGLVVALHVPHSRNDEYAASPAHARALAETVLPGLQSRFPLVDAPHARGLIGASLGAVASMHAAWSYPMCWGQLALLSGSFAFSDIGGIERGPEFERIVGFVNRFRLQPRRICERVYLACGLYESLIRENRALVPLLQTLDLEVRYREVLDGHNWENWRDRLRDGLGFLFPGPSWMVYD